MPGYNERGTQFRMQNTIFMLNLVDYLVGETDTYIPIRTRQRSHGTLRRIEQLIEDAQEDVNNSKQGMEKTFELKSMKLASTWIENWDHYAIRFKICDRTKALTPAD